MTLHTPPGSTRNSESDATTFTMTNIETLKGKRTAFKIRMTKNRRWAEREGPNATAEHIDAKLETLIEKFREWEISNEELYTMDSANLTAHENEADDIEENFHYLKGFMKNLINTKNARTPSPFLPAQPQQDPAASRKSYRIKLPEISLPTFAGSYDKYRGFRDQYNARIGNDPYTNDVVKLQYLQNCVTGPAAEAIANLEYTDANYKIAWMLLDEKFDKPRQALQRHWQTLFDLSKQPQKSEIEIVNIIRQQAQSLNAFGDAEVLLNAVYTTLITNLLDTEVVFQWETTIEGNDIPDYNLLLKFIEKRGICAQTTGRETNKQKTPQTQPKVSTQRPSSRGQKMSNHSSTSNVTRAQTFMTTNTRKCPVCTEVGHRIYECPKFDEMNIPQRDKLIRNQNRCLNCLSKGHGYEECISNSRCKICKEKHHTKIHFEKAASSSRSDA
ncbi:uncharacterized protein LOC135172508 [Diachasmimorpha longicaudata]|uniref:uncharacterized protein LOC135172508 n=1 Tax=Diachasmimorpha longicaudata TaxID=58733 RepID=UPI0030B8ED4A